MAGSALGPPASAAPCRPKPPSGPSPKPSNKCRVAGRERQVGKLVARAARSALATATARAFQRIYRQLDNIGTCRHIHVAHSLIGGSWSRAGAVWSSFLYMELLSVHMRICASQTRHTSECEPPRGTPGSGARRPFDHSVESERGAGP